ncbi:hypothetical protein PNQ29_06240 [Halobacterium salinarum]|uniref:hypothetical protein n=1 Tax=Halobacterium salinarum TaxID=2242 RepID=UPI00255581CA|nr:hypothetical protein [Halobacterium salinarum]MDL0119330.1 hypothetical protein [Halobacterium salinarum]
MGKMSKEEGSNIWELPGSHRVWTSLLFAYILLTILPGEPTVPVGYYSGYGVAISLLLLVSLFSIYYLKVLAINSRVSSLSLVVILLYVFSGIFHLWTKELTTLQTVSTLLIAAVTSLNVFVIPESFNLRSVAWTFSTISAISILAGLPSYIWGDITFIGFHFSPYATPTMLPIRDGVNAYFEYMNPMNRLAVWGAISSIFLYHKYSGSIYLMVINILGVVVSSRRQTVLLLVLLLPIAVAYWRDPQRTRKWVPSYIRLTLFGGIIAYFVFIVTPLSIPMIDVGTRMPIWKEMWTTILSNPLLGTGPREFSFSPVSGYLLAGVTSGVAGLISYLLVIVASLRRLPNPISERHLYISVMVFSMFLFQFFETYYLVGLNFDSTATAIFIGFLINPYKITGGEEN